MTKILILGSTGMLGNAVSKYFEENQRYDVTATYRNAAVARSNNAIKFDVLSDSPEILPSDFDYVINCIGVIKPFMASDPIAAIQINSLFPWLLARWCKKSGSKLFQITTDCVYSGAKGNYVETDPHDALDDYGKSKSLGECVGDAMVLRTSIIGEEIHKDASLIEWAKKQKGKTVGGFATHLWNGITTKEYARICDTIMTEDMFQEGLFHIFAADDVSKYDMMHMFNKKFNLGMTIEKKTPAPLDRTLRTNDGLCKYLSIPTVQQMIEEM